MTQRSWVLVGGPKVTAGMQPEFLADGATEILNEVHVLASASPSVVPVVGAESGTVVYSRRVILSNDVCLAAYAPGSKVTFEKLTNPDGYALSQVGAGEVVIKGGRTIDKDYSLAFGGRLNVDGALSIAPGVKLLLTGLDAAALDPNVKYTLVTATSLDGDFDTSGCILPNGWQITKRGSSIVLSYRRGLMLIVR